MYTENNALIGIIGAMASRRNISQRGHGGGEANENRMVLLRMSITEN